MRHKIHIHWHKAVIISCAFLILLAIQPAQAQVDGRSTPLLPNQPFSHLTTDDGLTHNSITAILQDQYGFMWIGTEGGLNLYDGYHIKTFKHEVGVEGSLSSNAITYLLEDDTGQIWVATATGGVSLFDRLKETFSQFNPTDDVRLNTAEVRTLTKGKDGQIWLGFARGALAQYDPQTEIFIEYPTAFPGRIDRIVIDNQGIVWLAGGSVLRFDPQTAVVTPYQVRQRGGSPPGASGDQPPDNPPPAPGGNGPPSGDPPPPGGSGPIADLLLDVNGTLWAASGRALHKFDPQTETFRSYDPTEIAGTSSPINKFYEDSQGFIWVGSGSGLSLFDLQTERFVNHFAEDPIRSDSLSSDEAKIVYEDAGGIIWIGTDAGISLLNRQQAQFTRYQFHPLDENSLATPSVGAIFVDTAGIVWSETELFLNRLDRTTGQITRYADEAEPFARGAPPHLQRWLGIHDDGQGALWLARWEGMYRFDKATGEFEQFAPENHLAVRQTRNGFRGMSTTDEGSIWLATGPIVYRFEPTQIEFEVMWQAQEVADGGLMVEDIYAGSTGDVWLNFGRNGIGRFSPKTRQLTPYRHDADDPNSLLPGVVHTIYQNQDVVWLGTSDGLTRLDLVTETFTHLGTDEGLPNTAVVAILPDNNGHLWLSTHKGLVQFDLQTSKAIRSYEVADGLPSNEFNRGAAFGTSNGELFFGSTNGLLVFDPAQIQDNSYHPPVVLTNMIVWHESEPVEFSQLSDQPIYLTEEIVLGPEDEFFQLEFAVLSYAAPAKNQFEYRLDGFDEQWWTNDDVGRPSVSYNHIDPGEYTFRARGTNSDGVWSENEVVLKIVAQPHWYDTRLARAFFVIIGLGTVLGLFANRMRNVQKRAVLLEAQVVERTRELSEQTEQLAVARDNAEAANRAKSTFLSNMSHELRSPLNAILGFSQVMQRSSDLSSENRDNLDIISRSGEHLLTLINQVLDLSKIEAGQAALNETDFDLRQLLRDVENMFRLKAEEQNLQLLFEGTHDVPQYMRTDEVKLRQVLINLLNNALKFTDEGGISVRVGQRDAEGNNTRLVFEVEDTGAGIAEEEMAQLFEAFAQTETGRKSQEGTGLGLPISRRFVQLMGGDMTVSSQVGLGTVFHFEITAQEAETADLSTTTSSRRVIALQPGQKRYRILIVDDLVTNRQLLVRLLGPLGFELREAGNGQEAINIWEEFKPHLIWMDMRMPILNGYEATQHIKSTTQGQATAVIALTASSFEGERHVILSAGCDDYLRKPFRENEMFEMMHKYLGVDYVYEAEVGIDDGRAPETPLQTADLTPVPAFLLNQLAQAIESIDLAQMDETIDEIRQQEPKTAEKLSRLVKQFEYDIILTTIEEATEANDEHN